MYWTFLNQGATQLMQFVVGIVMARLLSPEDFGITALPAVFMAIAASMMDCGFTAALIRKPEVTQKDLSTSFYYSILMGLFCYGLMYVASPFIADFYNTPILTPLIRVTSLTFLWGPLTTPQKVILNRRLDFKTQTRISIINKIISAIVGIAVAYAGYGIWALVASGICASLMELIQTVWVVKWMPTEKWDKESFKYLWNFGNKMLGANLIDIIYNNITPVFIGKYYSPRDLGDYNRALGFAKLPSEQISNVIQRVTFPTLSKIQDNDIKLGTAYRRIIRLTSFIVFPAMLLLGTLAKPIVLVLLTEKWEASIPYLQLMCVWWCWVPIHQINANLLLVKGKTDLTLRLTIIKRSIALCIMFFTLPMGIIPFLIGSIVNCMLVLIINTYYTGKLLNVGFIIQMKDIFPTILLSIGIALFVHCMTLIISNMLLQIFLGGGLGVVFYYGVAKVLNFKELDDVRYMLTNKK